MVRCLFEQVSFGLLVAWAKYERYIPVWEELLFKFFKHHQFWAFEKKIRIKEMPVLGIWKNSESKNHQFRVLEKKN